MTAGDATPPSRGVRILAAGEDAVLVEFPDTARPGPVAPAVLPFAAACADAPGRPDGVVEVVPAARTALVAFDPEVVDADTVRAWCAAAAESAVRGRTGTAAGGGGASAPGPLVVPVVYDGPDLDAVAEAVGMTAAQVVAAHTGAEWTVAFTGFAPGFGYLTGGDPRLEVPRRRTPRTRVPAGSVGLAGTFSGVYPRPSPGGWQIIGATDTALWLPDREPPALLTPGRRVRFAVADGHGRGSSGRDRP